MIVFGLVLSALAFALFALHATAVPVVFDVSVASLAVALPGAGILALGLRRERRRSDRRTLRLVLAATGLVVVAFVSSASTYLRFVSYRSSEITFHNGDVELSGTLFRPRGAGSYPAVVLVHGSGPETRSEYAFYAKWLARHGVAGLAYDKRGTGRSTGRLYASDYSDYADDALAGVSAIRGRDGIRTDCVGLWGFSEGEWVAPLAASRSGDVAFIVVVAPSGVTPAEQVSQEIAIRLRSRGYEPSDVDRALAMNERVFEYQRTGLGREALARDLGAASREPWFVDAEDVPSELYDFGEYAWWRSVMDFDPAAVWERVEVPVLLLKGGRDPKSSSDVAERRIVTALARGGNESAQTVVFPEGDHLLLEWPLGEHVPPPMFSEGYLDTTLRWIRGRRCAV